MNESLSISIPFKRKCCFSPSKPDLALFATFFSNFSCMFLNPDIFFSNWNSNCSSRNKLKKHSVAKNCSDLSLFEYIVLVISKFLQILGLQPRISSFIDHQNIFFSLRTILVTKYHCRNQTSLAETYYAHRREKVLRFLMSLSCFQHHLLGGMQKLNSRKAGNNRIEQIGIMG